MEEIKYNGLIIRYGEIALKGKNRPYFEKILMQNINRVLKKHDVKEYKLKKRFGFLELTFDTPLTLKEIESEYIKILEKVFGIYNISPYILSEKDINELNKNSLNLIKSLTKTKTFKVNTKRADKNYPLNSMEVNAKVGEHIINNTNLKVDIKNPEIVIHINISQKNAYLYHKTYKLSGGLPVGTQGKVISLISGGIDSPVASWLMMKRGAEVILLNIFSDKRNLGKIQKLKQKLEEYSSGREIKLLTINRKDIFNGFKNINLDEKHKKTAIRYTCLFCKNNMMHLAQKYAKEFNAKAIVMGDNLGQVASQTLDNIYVARSNIKIPVLSPLLTYDKEDIIKIAKKIGTYDISIINDYECSLRPKNPITKADLDTFNTLKKIIKKEIVNI